MIGSLLSAFGFMYFIFSLMMWEFNPGKWDAGAKGVYASLSLLLLAFTLAIRFPTGLQTLGWF